MSIEDNLKDLKIELPEPKAPVGAYKQPIIIMPPTFQT